MTPNFTKNTFVAIASLSVLASIAMSQPALAAPSSSSAPTLKIEHFIGTINIETGNYDKITVVDADGVAFGKNGENVSIDDDQKVQNLQCKNQHKGMKDLKIGRGRGLFKSAKNYKHLSEFPSIIIRAPQNTHLVIERSLVFGNVGNVGSGDIYIRACSIINFANITGDVDLHVSGASNVVVGDMGRADIHISGATDVDLGDVTGFAKIHSSGASGLNMGRIGGGLEYEGSGATDFKAAGVSGGDLSIRASGSSDVTIREGRVNDLYIRASGASDVIYKGSSVDADLRASGASDVSVRVPSGTLHESDSGAGDVHITH